MSTLGCRAGAFGRLAGRKHLVPHGRCRQFCPPTCDDVEVIAWLWTLARVGRDDQPPTLRPHKDDRGYGDRQIAELAHTVLASGPPATDRTEPTMGRGDVHDQRAGVVTLCRWASLEGGLRSRRWALPSEGQRPGSAETEHGGTPQDDELHSPPHVGSVGAMGRAPED
jgi:hypothetical protein